MLNSILIECLELDWHMVCDELHERNMGTALNIAHLLGRIFNLCKPTIGIERT